MGTGSVRHWLYQDFYHIHGIHGGQISLQHFKMWQACHQVAKWWDLYGFVSSFLTFLPARVGMMGSRWSLQGRTSHELLRGCSVSTRGSWMQWQQLQWLPIQRKQVWSVHIDTSGFTPYITSCNHCNLRLELHGSRTSMIYLFYFHGDVPSPAIFTGTSGKLTVY